MTIQLAIASLSLCCVFSGATIIGLFLILVVYLNFVIKTWLESKEIKF